MLRVLSSCCYGLVFVLDLILPVHSVTNRRNWQTKLGSSLKEKRHTSDFNKHVEDLFVNSDKTWPDSYRADFEYNRNLVFNMLVNLENTLSDRQRQHLLEEIAVLRKQLTELHQQN